jgi:hypothetical protein
MVAFPVPRLVPTRKVLSDVVVPAKHGPQFGVFPESPPKEVTEKFCPEIE